MQQITTESEPESDDPYETKPLLLSIPVTILEEGERRVAGTTMSVQNLITLTLAMAWNVPPPEIRKKGRPKRKGPSGGTAQDLIDGMKNINKVMPTAADLVAAMKNLSKPKQ